ncbi:unnamed protein product, partial [Rotaria magnacalcarata]
MSNQNITILTANGTAASIASTHHVHRVLQNFVLIWLDPNFDESNDDFKNAIQHLKNIIASITIFTDVEQCIDFVSDIEKEKVFLIASGSLGRHLTSCIEIHTWSQLHTIYVLDKNLSTHERWTQTISKIKGVYTQIGTICKVLKVDLEHCDRSLIPISYNGIDPLFMYTQLFKEALLKIEEDDTQSIKEFANFCRLQNDISVDHIDKFEREYHHHSPIWWYTAPYFLSSMLNRGLRLMDVEIILKMGFFIRHLHRDLETLNRENQCTERNETSFEVFRGQGLSLDSFEKMKHTEGGLISFNNFLSTSSDRKVSFMYAQSTAMSNDPNTVGILFVMRTDPGICNKSSIPFAKVANVGYYNDREGEILFATHTIFQINQIKHIQDDQTNKLWEVSLTIVGNDNHDISNLTSYLRKEVHSDYGWLELGEILLRLGETAEAKKLYQILFDKASSNTERRYYNNQLAAVYTMMADYSKALSSFETSLENAKLALPPNHPDMATSYHNIASVYNCMGKYSKALSFYERSLEIMKIALPSNHPDLATTYNSIGYVFYSMGDYSNALSKYKRSLEIMKIALPPNHPSLAASYNNIAMVYYRMDENSNALSSYEQSLEITKMALPRNHPDVATSYNNIGVLYTCMGEHANALSFHERSLEIRKIALRSNHPDLATSYNNIGSVYNKMGEYSKALPFYERSLEIMKIALPSNHPDLATPYNNIGSVYRKMGEYSKALASYELSLEIIKNELPPNHPLLASFYENIGGVYNKMGEYSKALVSYELSLEIMKIALPPNHPSLAISSRGNKRTSVLPKDK